MTLVVIALMALLCASLYYAYGIWTTLGLPGWMYVAMIGGVAFSLLVGGGLMGLVFYSARAGYDDRASHNDNS